MNYSKTILITGSNGFLGTNLVNFYSNKYNVLTFTKQDNIEHILSKQPDIIINCAASIYDIDSMFDTNVVLVNRLINYTKNHKHTKLIQIGSSAEYGKKLSATKESDNADPVSFYAGTKAAATMLCQSAAREFNLSIVVARPYSLYGNYEKSYRLFSKLLAAFVNQQEMTLADGYHDFIYVKDFVIGIDNLVSGHYDNGDIVNYGSGIQTSNKDVLDIFVEIFGYIPRHIQIVDGMAKAFESKVWICDTSYAEHKYNFKTQYSLKQGILDLIKTKGITP